MKRIFLATVVAMLLMNLPSSVFAQRNIDRQPAWGPVGYELAYFYYLPDLNIYYDVENALFYLLSGGQWVPMRYLPDKYKIYDLYSLYKVVINDDKTPWLNNKIHKKQYKIFQKDRTQTPIRFSHDTKYDQSKKNTGSWVNPDRGKTTTTTNKTSSPSKSEAKPSGGSKTSTSKSSTSKSSTSKSSTSKSSTSKSSGSKSKTNSNSKTSGKSGSTSIRRTSSSNRR